MLNAARLDYDGRIDLARLEAAADVERYEISAPEEVAARAAGADVILNKEMPLDAPLIAALPASVRLVCEAGTGYNNVDLAACHARGIAVCNVPTYATEAMAHMAVTFVMALACSLWPQSAALATGDRSYMAQCHLGALPHFELTGKTIGLVGGLGTIGLRVAAMATALGLRVVASDPAAPLGPRDDGVDVVTLDDLLARSDFVSLHCPLNARTTGLVGARAGQESEIPNFKGSSLGRFPLVSADFWTSDHLLERSRSVDAFFRNARARKTHVEATLNHSCPAQVGAKELAKMKPSAYLVNTARGAIVDQAALADALRAKAIAGAALDVFGEGSAPPPPLPDASPLWGLDNVILTPHIGWQRLEARQRVVDMCADNIRGFANGEPTNVDAATGLPRPRA